MRKRSILVLPGICLSLVSISCNERAQMGQGNQRNQESGRVIPNGFNNTLSPEQFRERALTLKGSALTLNASVEAALAGDELTEQVTDDSFSASCNHLAMLTGGTRSTESIRNFSQQTALNLSDGPANCKDIPGLTGIDSFKTMKALRFLTTELASNEHLVKDCLAMHEKRSGRQSAVAWTLEPVIGQNTWLDGKSLKYFAGGVEGGGNDRQNALSSWLNIETMTESAGIPTTSKIMTAIAAFNDVGANKTQIEKIEQYEQSSTVDVQNQIRITKIELDYAKGEIKETTTYQSLAKGALVSEWKIAATIAGADGNLVLELSSPGAAASIQYSLDAHNKVACTVSN